MLWRAVIPQARSVLVQAHQGHRIRAGLEVPARRGRAALRMMSSMVEEEYSRLVGAGEIEDEPHQRQLASRLGVLQQRKFW